MTLLLKLFSGARSLLGGLWGYLAVAFAAVGAVAIAYFKGHEAAEDAIEAKQAKQAAKVRKKAHTVALKGERRYREARDKRFDPRDITEFED